MKLNDMIFSDGKIIDYQNDDENLTLKFLDYCDNIFEIVFTGVITFEENDGVGFDISDSALKSDNRSTKLELLDDENICVFSIEFLDFKITRLKKDK